MYSPRSNEFYERKWRLHIVVDEHVDIAVGPEFIARSGTEQIKAFSVKTAYVCLMIAQTLQNLVSIGDGVSNLLVDDFGHDRSSMRRLGTMPFTPPLLVGGRL